MNTRRGYAAVEVLWAGVLVLLLLVAAWRTFSTQWSRGKQVTGALQDTETLRLVREILDFDLRYLRQGSDLREGDQEVVLRAFRGVAWVCGSDDPRSMTVAYRGVRDPAPYKDSLLVLDETGRWHAVDLLRTRRETGCLAPVGGESFALSVSEGPGDGRRPVAVRVFETGAYSLSRGAFRYRRGRGGRQPLTAEALAGESGLGAGLDGRVRARVVFDSGRPDWSGTVHPRPAP